jgi:hypothetical protein
MSSVRPASKQGRAGANRWAHTTVPGGNGLNTFQIQKNSKYFKTFQTLTDPKWPSLSWKFEIKYGFEAPEKVNNFLHRNFFRFGMDFNWKFQEFARLIFERILI